MVLGESGQKSFGGDDSGPSSSCGPCDFSITGHHRQSLGGRGTLDQTDDVVVGLDSGPGESHVNARTFNLVGLLHPVAHEDGGLASIATACDQVREFRKVDARKIGRKDSNHVQHVVCVDKEWHAWNSKGSGLRGMLTQLEATTRGDVGRSRAGFPRSYPVVRVAESATLMPTMNASRPHEGHEACEPGISSSRMAKATNSSSEA